MVAQNAGVYVLNPAIVARVRGRDIASSADRGVPWSGKETVGAFRIESDG